MRRKTVIVLAFVLVLLTLTTASALGTSSLPWWHDFTEAPAEHAQDEYLVVVFNDPPAASYMGDIPGLERTKPERGQKLDPGSPAVRAYVDHVANEHANYRAYLNDKAPRAEVVRTYSLVANALAVKRNGTRLQTIQQGPGVRYVAPSALYRPSMNVSVDLIGASALWGSEAGRVDAGAGIKVGVIDSGIDDTHRFFACKDQIPHKVYASGVAFDPSNTLVFDHGTHVAGTIAGCVIELTDGPIQDTISGVAPGAALYDYNVFPGFGAGFVAFGGSAFSHDIIAAIEDSVADGMDVINMSLGGGVEGPHDILAEAVNGAVDAGLVAAVAAGNSGPGDATVQSPGNAANALTAGASTNGHLIGVAVTVDGTEYIAAAGDFGPYGTAVSGDLVDWNDATSDDDPLACDAADSSGVIAGKIALISRGACTFTTKVRNAENAGAVGVVVYNNVSGPPVAMAHDGTDPKPTIPAVMVSQADGAAILDGLPASATIAGLASEFSAEADVIAGFSSRGPTPFNYLIKPDVTAPGVNVYSSVFDNGFAMFQGTSMATPHLAGSAALLIDLHPDWSQFDVKSAIVNTAARVVTSDGTEDPGVLARGNGRVALEAAADAQVTFDPVSASFGYWSGNKYVQDTLDLTLHDVSSSSPTCNVTVTGPGIVTASPSIVTVDGMATVTLTLDAGKANDTGSGDYDGDVEFDCDGNGEAEYLVPWWLRIDRQAP